MMLGSIPQQDVFQRVTSSRTRRSRCAARCSAVALYFLFAFVPMFLAYSATLIDPKLVSDLHEDDSQLILPTLILQHTPLFAQIIFFGALLSAIMSCSSATLLAPSVSVHREHPAPILARMTDRTLLRTMRIVLAGLHRARHPYALNSKSTIFQMVESAYKITLVAAFIPLVCGHLLEAREQPGRTSLDLCGVALARGPLSSSGRCVGRRSSSACSRVPSA